jgi:hypothetical protein
MTPDLPMVSAALTAREMRRDPTLAPGGPRFGAALSRFIPLVHGIGAALIPESAEAAEAVAVATLHALVLRWRKISRGAPLATWLVRTACYAAARERSRRGLKRRSDAVNAVLAQAGLKQLNGFKPRVANAVVLCGILGEPTESAAVALRSKAARIQKRFAKGETKIQKALNKVSKKYSAQSLAASSWLASLAAAPGGGIESRILTQASEWDPRVDVDRLAKSAIAAWRWRAVGRFFNRLGATVGTMVLLLVATGFTIKFLVDHGKFNIMMVFMRAGNKDLLKEYPDLKKPAQPWPVKADEMAMVARKAPSSPAEMYATTNIWPVKIKMTPEQWAKVQPMSIPPAPQLPNGKMALRNSKASRSGLAGAIGIDFPWSEGALDFGDTRFEQVGVRYRGNGTFINSLYGNKQSFKVDLNRVKKGQRLGGVTSLNFVNSIPDLSYIHDAMAERVFRELGAVAPRTSYAYLTLDVAGKFRNEALGLYVMVENIDGNFAKEHFGTKDAPIFKPVTYDLFVDRTNDWSAYKEDYDLKTKATKEQLARVVDFSRLVSHASDEEFAQKLPDYLDLEEYAAFVAGHVLMSSYDGYLANGQNFYMYLDPRSNKFGFIPWDQDHGWGEFGYVDTAEHRENASIWKPAAYNNVFLARVLKAEPFKKVYRKKLEEALAGPFSVERLNREIDELAEIVRPAVAAESSLRSQRFEIAVSTNFVSGPRDAKGNWSQREGLRAPAHQIKRFILARTKSVRDQLDGKSEGVLIRGFNE